MRIGIDLGGSHIAVGIIDENGKIIIKKEEELKVVGQEKIENIILDKIIQNINLLLKVEKINKKDIKMIGIACPGIVTNDTIIKIHNLGIENFTLGKLLYNQLRIPIFLKNDAKCAAIAEKEYGCLQNYQNAIFLTIGTGIGGAIFYQDHLLQSNISETFEIGHMIIQKNGKVCNCGKNGCFERYASIRALKEMTMERYQTKEIMTGMELHDYINQHSQEQKMKDLLEQYIDYLSIGVTNMITIYKPEAIGFGGSFVYYQELFMEQLNKKIVEYTYHNNIPKLEIAQMKNDAGMIGASRINM